MFDISLNFSSIPEDEHPVEVSEYLASVLYVFLRLQMSDFYRRDNHVVDKQTEEGDIGFFFSLIKKIYCS